MLVVDLLVEVEGCGGGNEGNGGAGIDKEID